MKHRTTIVFALAAVIAAVSSASAQTSGPRGVWLPGSPYGGTTSAFYNALADYVKFAQGDTHMSLPKVSDGLEVVAYLRGIQELLMVDYIVKPKWHICVTSGVSNATLARIVKKFIDAHPQAYSWPTGAITMMAYQQAFPCHK